MANDIVNDNRSLPQLLSDLTSDLSTLLRKEIQLARAEISEKARQLGRAAGGAAIGAVLLLAALFLVLQAAVFALAALIGLVWACLAVAILVALIGAGLVKSAMSAAKPDKLKLERTGRQLQDTVRMAKDQVR